jgi:hypothetical protein
MWQGLGETVSAETVGALGALSQYGVEGDTSKVFLFC